MIQPQPQQVSMTDNSSKEKSGVGGITGTEVQTHDHIEEKSPTPGQITPYEIQQRFSLLQDLSNEQMARLNNSVVRKLDWRMMPCITLMFLMAYLDRINVSNARLAGLQTDLGMDDTMWNLGISAFYIGYVIGQLPGNLWLAKANPRFFLPSVMMAWSTATICMPAMVNGAGFAVCRFFIGLCEAPFFPGITLMTSSWYTKEENPLRMAIWHAGNTISNIISGFLAAGILTTMDGTLGLHAWKWFFIIEGAISITVAVAAFFLLPDWPHNTRFLTPEETEMAQYRVLCSNGGMEEHVGGTWDGLKDAVRDPFTWCFCLMHFALVTAQSFKDFLPSIVNTFDFGELTTYFIQAPPYAFSFAFACAVAWSAGRHREHVWHIIVPIFFSAVGCSILISTENVGARYFGIFILISGTYSGLNLQLSWETTVVPSPRSKKAALIAIANCISQTSHWFSPYFWPRSQEPFYRLGGGLILVGCLFVVLSTLLARWRCVRLNKKLDEAEGWTEHSGNEKGWRYTY
ncbi:probable permeases of the major facilitator superfamily [Cephalotrichum gorgonifer]|uniref:Probable permeases of the major facilitator superfamily n=1 Tax=Cephalotrichum gorgonifer TaxID=2041049 RepID=A0AAE8N731_9PEZI|nr:probable permeases of the major facilitator superfamily [Cephalotrichum gorgonifer]